MPLKSADAAFDRLADAIFRSLIDLNPTEATRLGIHGPNDSRLPERSRAAAEQELALLHEHLAQLARFREKELSIDRAVDLRLARGGINARILRLQRCPPWRTCPKTYVDDVVTGLYTLMIRQFSPVPKRARAMLDRLKQVPAHLEGARESLENPSPLFTESAAFSARGALDLFDTTLREFIGSVGEPRLSRSLLRAARGAREAMSSFGEWLEGNLMPRSSGDFAIGKAMFERLLSEEHLLHWSSNDLIAAGQRVYQDTLREMKRVASRIESDKPWSKVVENLKLEHPREDEILATYRSEVERARSFVERNVLVTIPEGESIEVVPTPEFARPMFPFAAYLAPAPFENERRGLVWVTTIDPSVDEVHRQSLLRGHARHGIVVTALHEAVPGHHLQLTRANELRERKLRFLFRSSTFVEGWALYCEDMMYQHGFFRSDPARLLQLKDLLWRACRVILDVELQTGGMGFNEAVNFLVRKAHIERQNAVAEVRRYCATPTQPMSYVVGKILIEELLEDYREIKGEHFDLRTFHDELLSHGAIPIELIRMEMGVPRCRPTGRRSRRSASWAARAMVVAGGGPS